MLGERMKQLREKRNLRQIDVSSALGIGRTTYAMYEQGQRQPDPETLQKLADFFKVQVDYLLGRTDSSLTQTYDYKTDPSLTPEFRELIEILDSLPPDEKKEIIQQALTYAAGKKARNRLSRS